MAISEGRNDPACRKRKKASGGQKGHKGKTLTRSEVVGKVIYHLPGCCDRCGRQFGQEEEMKVVASR